MALVSPLVFIILVRRHKPNYVSLKQCFNKPLLNKTMFPLYSYYQPKTVASDLHDYGAPRDSICEVLCGFRGALYQNKHTVLSACTGTHTLVYCLRQNPTQQEVFDFYNKKVQSKCQVYIVNILKYLLLLHLKQQISEPLRYPRIFIVLTLLSDRILKTKSLHELHVIFLYPKLTCWTWNKKFLTLLIF